MRRVPSGSFDRLSAPLALWRALHEHARGKGRRPAVARLLADADRHVFALSRALRSGAYQPGPFHQLVVRDPKLRLISTPTLRDRVIHQALVAELAPHFERSYIDQSYACLAGRGPLRAVLRHQHEARRWRFRVHLDIRRYFPSVDHELLLDRVILPRLADPRAIALLRRLFAAGGAVYRTPLALHVLGDPPPPATGLPIGSSLSQWAANLYLDGLDHFVKRTLKIPGYLRYMDDFVLFADSRAQLQDAQDQIAAWLHDHRRLRLKAYPVHVHRRDEPHDFLGWRLAPGAIRPGATVRRRMPGKLRRAAARGPAALARTIAAYRALWELWDGDAGHLSPVMTKTVITDDNR